MWIPYFSAASAKRNSSLAHFLFPRKGGRSGGGDSGGSGSSSGRGSSGDSGGSSSSGARSPVSIGSGESTGGHTSATAYGAGGGKVQTIASGQLFAGRSQGGGTRNQVAGTQTYGSGYPGISQRGVNGLGFPFYFWPVTWGAAAGAGSVAYLHDTEYGDANNSSRPGSVLMTVPFSSNSSNTTFHIVSDNATTTALLSSISSNCSSVLNSNSTGSQSVTSFNTSDSNAPKPEQAVMYYRASSVVLTLDGYNDSTALNETAGVNDTHTSLPSWVDTNLLDCVNQTTILAAPLVDGALTPTTTAPFCFAFLWLLFFIV